MAEAAVADPTPSQTQASSPSPEPTPPPALTDAPADPAAASKEPAALTDPPKDAKAEPKAAEIDVKALKLPDGAEIDEPLMTGFSTLAKELGISQEGAQKLLDHHFATVNSMAEKSNAGWEATNKAWVAEVKADKEIGGDNLPAVQTTISKALDQFGTPEARKALAFTGAGNHPAIIKALYNMAKQLTEGGHIAGQPARKPSTAAEAIYGVPSGRN